MAYERLVTLRGKRGETAEPALLVEFLNHPKNRESSAKVEIFLENLKRLRSSGLESNAEFGPRYNDVPPLVRWFRRAVRPFSTELSCEKVSGRMEFLPVYSFPTSADSYIHSCIELDRDGLLDRVRRCVWCNVWFAARRENQKFCNSGCKQQAFRSTPQYRKKSRAYMRKYRASAGRAGR